MQGWHIVGLKPIVKEELGIPFLLGQKTTAILDITQDLTAQDRCISIAASC